ncbi:hypothetical protein [Ignavibacterium album]|nr:hypothetical protein [Ignavibacterium album]
MIQHSIKNNQQEIFSWKEVKENPFELFKSEFLTPGFLFNKQNLDSKLDWAVEYEMIYYSQLMET